MSPPLALLSVHDKTGLVAFARGLIDLGYALVASGGTARALAEAGLTVLAVEDLTGFPELLAGRVKTLHPVVHAGILSRRNADDTAELAARDIRAIDLVAVDLYPFERALAGNAAEAALIEEIDIGGVTLLRAAAKSFEHVTVVPGPEHYDAVLNALANAREIAREGLRKDGEALAEGLDVAAHGLASTRRRLAALALAKTSAYDRAIADWLASAPSAQSLRYGENPHQEATFQSAAALYTQHAGKELSYNNLLDLDAAWGAVADFAFIGNGHAHAVVVKHGSPSGIARAATAPEAVAKAIAADPTSAFGGIVALDLELDLATALALGDLFLEVVAAPSASDEAIAHLRAKKKNCRVLTLSLAVGRDPRPRTRTVLGGALTQSPDLGLPDLERWTTVTQRPVAPATLTLLTFAWLAGKHVKSNAIVLAASDADGALVTVGIGGGQTNRIDAVRQACERAGPRAAGAVLASDAFFPFADGLEVAAAAGVVAVVQPGGALRDSDVIASADRLGLAMVFTHRRHFRH